mmetsp:Transcript_28765/g.48524  ORF Transcript_28765/g.48524 Transcript_28765/m.48524 type:complete len:276 (+) Transcript_28765:144-971(+)|eukprot:CAMPEP_0114472468 /NCGR_PEP_ID=MMETSP0104-20121206/12407_1 /TAXON_ID=37642 ORGANISM="Paraphysomonas imperforata, Strain PA2" /NCGR_SAMPLE_ID=MMETSP0104 /ASSEMBLY_ACC=CAM_ASM_000202 /LENGTH=275 /DNA_ID=CAMNT_0001646473 /DNA_START=59 /DNA_END=886 /DNA_ORIENTATION=-
MSGRSTSNESAQSALHQSPNNRKLKSPSANSVPIVYNYQNYPQSDGDAEEEKSQGDFDLHIKLLMLGDSGVGKSSLVLQYAHEEFTSNFVTTIGIDYKIKLLKLGKTKIKLQIWDTAGQERFRTITTSYFKGADGIMLVYDLTDRESFENIVVWAKDIREHADPHVGIILVGNKKDLTSQREISYDEGLQLARRMNVHFYEVSAKVGDNVTKAFESIADTIKDDMLHPESNKKRPKLDNIVLQDSSMKKSKNQDSSSRSGMDSRNGTSSSKSNCC